MRKFAAFDIDGTLGRSSLFLDVVHELLDTGHLPAHMQKELLQLRETYKKRAHPDAFKDYSSHSVSLLLDNMNTLLVEDYRKAVDSVVERTKGYIHVYTRDLIKRLKADGYFLIALSGSEMYAVQEFTTQFDFDIAVGEYYHHKNGAFTGEVDEVFHKKGAFLEKFAAEYGLTFKDSIAVGDSMGDFGMLEIVDNPIVFNPEKRLYKKAREKGWKIVIERKNVIYELEGNNGSYVLA